MHLQPAPSSPLDCLVVEACSLIEHVEAGGVDDRTWPALHHVANELRWALAEAENPVDGDRTAAATDLLCCLERLLIRVVPPLEHRGAA